MVQHFPDGEYAWEGNPAPSEIPIYRDEVYPLADDLNWPWDGDEDASSAARDPKPIPPPPSMLTAITHDERQKRSMIVRNFWNRLTNEAARRTDVLPRFDPFSVLVYAKEHGFCCDEIVTLAVQHSIDIDVDDDDEGREFGTMILGRLFVFLESWRKTNRHEQVGLSILSPNQVPDYLIGMAMLTQSFEICDVFFEHGLDAKRLWKFKDQIVDVWYWVAITGAESGMGELLDKKVKPLAGIDHVAYAAQTVRRAVADISWGECDCFGYMNPDHSPAGRHWESACWIFNEVWGAKLSPKNNPSIAPDTPVPGTGLLAYLAGDMSQRECVLRRAWIWARVKKGNECEMLPTLDVDELCPRDQRLMHGFSIASGRPQETPLIEAVLNQWGKMVDMLLDLGADIDKKGHSGMTAYEVAKANGLDNMVMLLEEQKWARGWIGCGLAVLRKSRRYLWPGEPTDAGGDAQIENIGEQPAESSSGSE